MVIKSLFIIIKIMNNVLCLIMVIVFFLIILLFVIKKNNRQFCFDETNENLFNNLDDGIIIIDNKRNIEKNEILSENVGLSFINLYQV